MRKTTNLLLDMIEDGVFSAQDVLEELLQYLSEQEVDSFARECNFIGDDENIDDDLEDLYFDTE